MRDVTGDGRSKLVRREFNLITTTAAATSGLFSVFVFLCAFFMDSSLGKARERLSVYVPRRERQGRRYTFLFRGDI